MKTYSVKVGLLSLLFASHGGGLILHSQIAQVPTTTNIATAASPSSVPNERIDLITNMATYDSSDSSDEAKGRAALRIAQLLGERPCRKAGDFYTCIQYYLAAEHLGQKGALEMLRQTIKVRQAADRTYAIYDLYGYLSWAKAKASIAPQDALNLKPILNEYGRYIELPGHRDQVSSVAFNSDGKLLASGSWDNTVKLWDMNTFQCKATLTGQIFHVNNVAFSPDGKALASGSSDNSIRLWDVATAQCKAILATRGVISGSGALAFSPDDLLLASGSIDSIVKLWNLSTKTLTATLVGHSGAVNSVTFNPDGKTMASGSSDNTIRIWDVATGKCSDVLSGQNNTDCIVSIDYSPDGKTLVGCGVTGTIQFWPKRRSTLAVSGGSFTCVKWSPDGQSVASQSDDGTIKIWDVATGACLLRLEGQVKPVSNICFSPDGQTLAAGNGDKVQIWYVGDCMVRTASVPATDKVASQPK